MTIKGRLTALERRAATYSPSARKKLHARAINFAEAILNRGRYPASDAAELIHYFGEKLEEAALDFARSEEGIGGNPTAPIKIEFRK